MIVIFAIVVGQLCKLIQSKSFLKLMMLDTQAHKHACFTQETTLLTQYFLVHVQLQWTSLSLLGAGGSGEEGTEEEEETTTSEITGIPLVSDKGYRNGMRP